MASLLEITSEELPKGQQHYLQLPFAFFSYQQLYIYIISRLAIHIHKTVKIRMI
jgi:hypothetical protein